MVDYAEMIKTISELAFNVTQFTKTDVFVDWAAHVKKISVVIFVNGWEENKKADFSSSVYINEEMLSHNDILTQLSHIEKELRKY